MDLPEVKIVKRSLRPKTSIFEQPYTCRDNYITTLGDVSLTKSESKNSLTDKPYQNFILNRKRSESRLRIKQRLMSEINEHVESQKS